MSKCNCGKFFLKYLERKVSLDWKNGGSEHCITMEVIIKNTFRGTDVSDNEDDV